jgi:hypothetical protein
MTQLNLNYRVSHITQHDVNYCWACAFAMIKGRSTWADAVNLSAQIPVTARNVELGTLTNPSAAAQRVGLRHHPLLGGLLTPHILADFMTRGAIAIFGRYSMAGRTVDHVTVCSMLRGNEFDVNSIRIGIDDPWANGTRWTGTWNQFYGPWLIAGHAVVTK